MENLGHGERAVGILHGLPGQGRPAEIPSGGIPRTSVDKDGYAGTFSALHVLDTMVVLEEINLPHPQCP